jgi:hypothetical protein
MYICTSGLEGRGYSFLLPFSPPPYTHTHTHTHTHTERERERERETLFPFSSFSLPSLVHFLFHFLFHFFLPFFLAFFSCLFFMNPQINKIDPSP